MRNLNNSDIDGIKQQYQNPEIVDLMISLEEEWSYQISMLGRTQYQALVVAIAEIIGTNTDRPSQRVAVAASWLRFKTK